MASPQSSRSLSPSNNPSPPSSPSSPSPSALRSSYLYRIVHTLNTVRYSWLSHYSPIIRPIPSTLLIIGFVIILSLSSIALFFKGLLLIISLVFYSIDLLLTIIDLFEVSEQLGMYENNDNNINDADKKKILFVCAHPDDESLFFTPTINALLNAGHDVYLLCFSRGQLHYDYHTRVRFQELKSAMEIMGIDEEKWQDIDDDLILDGSDWRRENTQQQMIKYLKEACMKWKIDAIITFDDYGITNHPNHQACFYAVQRFIRSNPSSFSSSSSAIDHSSSSSSYRDRLHAYSLISIKNIRHYLGLMDAFVSTFEAIHTQSIQKEKNQKNASKEGKKNYYQGKTEIGEKRGIDAGDDEGEVSTNDKKMHHFAEYLYINPEPLMPFELMEQGHWSQFVWFRMLSVIFSRYVFVNTLKEIH